ncbi:helix-turn-helix domain-containing protein [Sandaracinus amylolyticus]|uniref:helix-turn-helix domain-containing protein n=1 Tax=Sandaracinus amylolyticus TaxID=927083 RepID=UPI001F3C1BF0|nr:helix-turn-helix domain-containing protein [Sandaracinus amylolyticus]
MSEVSDALLEGARALARGDALRALGVAGRDESALGLTLRGIAYAQLGDLALAREALARATERAPDPHTLARARAAMVEVALAAGDPKRAADEAIACASALEQLGDRRNAAMQRLVLARAEVLRGRLNEARGVVEDVLSREQPADLRAVAWLARAEIAMRALAASESRDALEHARSALEIAPHELLSRALVSLERELSAPVARVVRGGVGSDADLFAIEALSGGEVLLVDACRRVVIGARLIVRLGRRPVLFALLAALARAWPDPIARDELASSAFEVRRVNPSHRARLRVEIGRLRKAMHGLAAEPIATKEGYVLSSQREVVVLSPPGDDDEGARIALVLGDGASWSARELATHTGLSIRTVQRALASLVESGRAVRSGRGARVRYTRPGTPIASRMLLLGLLPAS